MAYNDICHFTDAQRGFPGWAITQRLLQSWLTHDFRRCLQSLLLFMSFKCCQCRASVQKPSPPYCDICMLRCSACYYFPEVYGDVTCFEVDFITSLICISCLFCLPLPHLSLLVQEDSCGWQLMSLWHSGLLKTLAWHPPELILLSRHSELSSSILGLIIFILLPTLLFHSISRSNKILREIV
jgi:hypothetical protein